MEILNAITQFLSKLLQWYFIVMPWEQAILVRGGKKSKVLGPGTYFKVPFYDAAYVQTTRTRALDMPMQTITSRDGITVTLKTSLWYSIKDVLLLYKTLYQPEMTLNGMVAGHIGDFIRTHDIKEITPDEIEKTINSKVDFAGYGLSSAEIKITSFATVRTYRIMQEGTWMQEGLQLDKKL